MLQITTYIDIVFHPA